MEKPHIYFNHSFLRCSICKTQEEASSIKDGESEYFKLNIMMDKINPGKYDQNLLGSATCKVCDKETRACPLPYLYYGY